MDLIKKLRAQFSKYDIDGYIIPKNDEFFSEFSNKDRLKKNIKLYWFCWIRCNS